QEHADSNGKSEETLKEPSVSSEGGKQGGETNGKNGATGGNGKPSKKPWFFTTPFWTDGKRVALSLIFDFLLLIATSVYTLFASKQWQTMRDQVGIMQGTLEEQRRSGRESTNQIWQAIGNLNWSARSSDLEQKATESGIKGSQRQSKLALDASIDASRLDERPWVIGSSFTLSKELDSADIPITKITVANVGKTPALDMVPTSEPYIWNESISPLGPLEEPKTKSTSLGVLAPGQTGVSFSTNPWLAPEYLFPAYKDGGSRYYVRAKVTYTDVNRLEHWTTICAYHIMGHPLTEFTYCSSGNDVDRNDKKIEK
ncbi:MAG: hypothetical protein WBV46_14810, partial [Terriglobales bacterium]